MIKHKIQWFRSSQNQAEAKEETVLEREDEDEVSGSFKQLSGFRGGSESEVGNLPAVQETSVQSLGG